MKTIRNNRIIGIILLMIMTITSLPLGMTTKSLAADTSVSDVTGLQDAVTNAADGDVITLEGGFAYGNATIAMPNVNVTIDGGNNVWNVGTITVNGTGTGSLTIQNLKMDGSGALPGDMRLINIESSAGKVILENIELYGANYLVNASAGAIGISTKGTAITEINKAYIHDNKANGGPAIKISENSTSNIFINDSTIERNSGHQGGYEAGAVSSKFFSGTLEINNTVFRENKNRAMNTGVVGGGGGAMSMHYLYGKVNINESLFERNETSGEGIPPASTYDGGAIYILDGQGENAELMIKSTTFDSNLAYDDGGAILVQGKGGTKFKTDIINSTFYNNRAYGLTGSNKSGGAIQFFRGGMSNTMTNNILSSTFINNISGNEQTRTNQQGGAIGLSGGSVAAPLNRNDSLFIGNQVYGSNGEINYASRYKDVSNTYATQDGTFNLINVDKELDEVATKAKLKEVLGTSTPVLLENYSTIKAGVDGEIIKTIPIKPESRADNTYTGTVAAPADDQRIYSRYKDQGAVEISWVKYNANGGAFGLDEMTSYDGKVYYEKDAEDNETTNAIKDKITSYYTVGYIAGDTKVLDGEADLDVIKDNKVFKGWSTDKDATEADANYPVGKELTYVSENLTLYAVWGEETTKPPVDPTDPGEPGGTIKDITLVGGRATLTNKMRAELSNFKQHELYGKDRYATSVQVSKAYKNSDTIVLASGEKYTDELTATVLASKLDVPILLSEKDVVPEVVIKEIERLGATKVILIGEKGTLSKSVETQLSKYKLERIGGVDRYETAVLIGDQVRTITGNKTQSILVDGTNFPDAIAMTSMGVEQGLPIILTQPNELNKITEKAVKDWGITKVTIGGGTASVSSNIESTLKATVEVERIKGTDRYETSVLVAKQVYKNPTHAVIASGEVFPDAIVGAPYAAKNKYPIVLSRGNSVPQVVLNYVNGK